VHSEAKVKWHMADDNNNNHKGGYAGLTFTSTGAYSHATVKMVMFCTRLLNSHLERHRLRQRQLQPRLRQRQLQPHLRQRQLQPLLLLAAQTLQIGWLISIITMTHSRRLQMLVLLKNAASGALPIQLVSLGITKVQHGIAE